MNPYAVSSLLSAVVMAGLSAFVFLRNPRNTLNRVFMVLCVSMSFWAFTEYEMRNAQDALRAQFWHSAGMIWPFAIALLLHFALIFTERRLITNPALRLAAIYGPAALFTVFNAMAGYAEPVKADWGWAPQAVQSPREFWLLASTYAWAAFCSVWSLVMCVLFTVHATTAQRRKMGKHVSFGMACVVIPGLASEVILPAILGRPVMELTSSSCAIMAAFVTYAIIKYELFPITPVTAAESIVTTISDPLLLVDLSQTIRTVNPAACSMMGYEPHELLGHPLSRVFPPPPEEERPRDFVNMLKTGVVSDVETEFVTKSGKHIPISLSWSMTRGIDGKVIGVTFIGRDITERTRLQESLRKARDELAAKVEEQTRELTVTNRLLREEIAERMKVEEQLADDKEYLTVTLRSIADGAIATDRAGRIVLLNRAAEEMTGWRLDEARGRPLPEVFQVYDEKTRQPLAEQLRTVIESGEGVRFSESSLLIARDGTQRVIADSGAPIRHQSGKVRGTVLVFRDVSERRKLEERTHKTRRLESINALASGIAHDFNNVLTHIMTTLFMARTQAKPDSDMYTMLSDAEQAAFRASALTKQLLTLAKETPPMRQRTRLREVVEDAAGYALKELNVGYELTVAPEIDEVELDRGQMDQAVSAIVTNAAEAMSSGGTMSIAIKQHGVEATDGLSVKPGAYAVLAISDAGPGISEENLQRVFDPYFSTKPGHSGLGLTLAHAIVGKHDGCVDIVSGNGTGTTVSVYLPLAPSEPTSDESELETAGVEDTSPQELRVLFMDDEEYLRRNAVRLLTHLGYEPVTASDGDEAVRLYREAIEEERPFDVAILDLMVNAGKGAKESLEEIRAMDPEARVIVSSGYTNDPVVHDYAQFGFNGALTKPYAVDRLDNVLREILRDRV